VGQIEDDEILRNTPGPVSHEVVDVTGVLFTCLLVIASIVRGKRRHKILINYAIPQILNCKVQDLRWSDVYRVIHPLVCSTSLVGLDS